MICSVKKSVWMEFQIVFHHGSTCPDQHHEPFCHKWMKHDAIVTSSSHQHYLSDVQSSSSALSNSLPSCFFTTDTILAISFWNHNSSAVCLMVWPCCITVANTAYLLALNKQTSEAYFKICPFSFMAAAKL